MHDPDDARTLDAREIRRRLMIHRVTAPPRWAADEDFYARCRTARATPAVEESTSAEPPDDAVESVAVPERRRHKRFGLQWPARIVLDDDVALPAETVDLSEGGAHVVAADVGRRGRWVELELEPAADLAMRVWARVIEVSPVEGGRSRWRLKFNAPTPAVVSAIAVAGALAEVGRASGQAARVDVLRHAEPVG